MRPILQIAERFLRERAAWRKCCDTGVDNAMRAAAMAALAWVLDVDLELMTAPKVGRVPDPPDAVRLTRIESLGAWLVEFPPCREPEYASAYWAAFLSHRQLLDLMKAGMLALVPGLYLLPIRSRAPSSRCCCGRVRGGVLSRLTPMAICREAWRERGCDRPVGRTGNIPRACARGDRAASDSDP